MRADRVRPAVAYRPAGQLENFERADDPASVAGMKAGSGPRVEDGETLVERGVAVPEGVALEPQAKLLIGPGPREQTAEQRLQVEGRTTDKENSLASRLDLARRPSPPIPDTRKRWPIATGR